MFTVFFLYILAKGREAMTDFQTKANKRTRMRGVGYCTIASVVGLSRDIELSEGSNFIVLLETILTQEL